MYWRGFEDSGQTSARRLRPSVARVLALFALLPGVFPSIAADSELGAYPSVTTRLQVERVGDTNAYYIPGRPAVPGKSNQGLTANAGFVVTEEGVVAFDALGTPSLGKAMIEAIRRITDKPITHLVVSHYHADHIYGLQAFKDFTGAEIIAHEKSSSYIGSREAEQRLAQRRQSLAPWVNETTRVVPPDSTFADEMRFELGGSRFTLVYAGPAHGPDDILMMVEPGNVLFSGDIVQRSRVPFLDSPQVDSAQWLAGLDKVKALDPRHLVPGHGRASVDALPALEFTQGYIRFVRERMKEAVDNWVQFEDAYQQTDWSEYEDLPAFKSSNKGNAYRVYLEMEKAAFGG